jgi:hypothetical protein
MRTDRQPTVQEVLEDFRRTAKAPRLATERGLTLPAQALATLDEAEAQIDRYVEGRCCAARPVDVGKACRKRYSTETKPQLAGVRQELADSIAVFEVCPVGSFME